MMGEGITAAGGFCAPSETLFGTGPDWKAIHGFPDIKVSRGGIKYEALEETPAQDAMRAYIARQAAAFAEARRVTIDNACLIGMSNGWDIHITEPPTVYTEPNFDGDRMLAYMRPIGIEFTPAEHRVPTLTFRRASEWDDHEVWDDL
jgi:hypothetical protein